MNEHPRENSTDKPPVSEPVCVYRAANLQEAHLVLDLLTASGIAARIASSAVEPLAGEVPFQLLACPIWAPASQREQAKRVLAEHEQTAEKLEAMLYCYHCGEALDSQAAVCPQCNSTLDWSTED